MGEIGLAGELRRVRDLPQRIAEAARLGFRVAVVPEEPGKRGGPDGSSEIVDGMRVLSVPDIGSALRLLRLTDSEAERRTS
jgi:DNA repair protein RadA/Sms